jgi:hypothetical protein
MNNDSHATRDDFIRSAVSETSRDYDIRYERGRYRIVEDEDLVGMIVPVVDVAELIDDPAHDELADNLQVIGFDIEFVERPSYQ